MRELHIVMIGAIMAAAAACSPTRNREATMTVQGTLSTKSVRADNARAVAVGDNGKTYWAYLDRHGDFSLELPIGQSYRILLANQLPGGGQQKIGHVVVRGAGGPTEWLGANDAVKVNLGKLKPAATSTSSGSLRPQCGACGGGEGDESEADDEEDSDHDDDFECHDEDADRDRTKCDTCSGGEEDDADDDEHMKCDVCSGGEDKPLEPSKQPGDECEDKNKDKHGDWSTKEDRDDDKPCPLKKGGGQKSGGEKSGGEKSGAGASEPGDEGSSCHTTSSCSSTCSCIASKCVRTL